MTVAYSDRQSSNQPCMWFMEEPRLFSMGQTAQSLTCSIMEKPHTRLDDCQICYWHDLEKGTLPAEREIRNCISIPCLPLRLLSSPRQQEISRSKSRQGTRSCNRLPSSSSVYPLSPKKVSEFSHRAETRKKGSWTSTRMPALISQWQSCNSVILKQPWIP